MYTISLTGSADSDDVTQIFEDTVRAIRQTGGDATGSLTTDDGHTVSSADVLDDENVVAAGTDPTGGDQ